MREKKDLGTKNMLNSMCPQAVYYQHHICIYFELEKQQIIPIV